MSPRTARWFLNCYPRRWRDRYEEEFQAVLEECPLSFHLVVDVVCGGLDARWSYGRPQRRLAARRRRTAFIAACVLLAASTGVLPAVGPFQAARPFRL